jgi:hypothetical protein
MGTKKKPVSKVETTEKESLNFVAFIWHEPDTKEKYFSSFCHVSEIDLNGLVDENLISEQSFFATESEAKQKQFELAKNFNIDYQFN